MGRRVPKNLARTHPTLDKLALAARSLGLEFKIEPEKAHPKAWWEPGRIAVKKVEKKEILLKKLAKKMKSLRK